MGKGNRIKGSFLLLLIALLVTTLTLPATAAQGPVSGRGSRGSAPQGVDDNYLEVGVEWVNDYPYCCRNTSSGQVCGNNVCDLSLCDDDAEGLKNQLGGCGWIKRFNYGNGSAWEEDFKGYSKPGGGTEYRYIDRVDLAYFAGHGNSSSFVFGEGGRNHDDAYLTYSDCRLEWGNGDLDWIAISSCQVLANSHRTDWSWCMNGLHLLMGFVTNMADAAHGVWFGWLICHGYNMTQAWFTASDISQPDGRIVRVLAEEHHHFWDRPSDHNASDAMDYSTYWSWDHHTASAPPRQVDPALLQGEMPVFETPYLSLEAAENQWAQLSGAFGVDGTAVTEMYSPGQDEIWMSGDSQLQMDPSTGLYTYVDLNNLWAQSAPTAASEPVQKMSPQDAKDIADQFLISEGLMPADAQFDEVVPDTQSQIQPPPSGFGLETVLQSEDTALQVVYSRVLSYTLPTTVNGVQQTVEFSVEGPGSKLKVFVDPNAVQGQSDGPKANPAVIGGTGGWRPLGQLAGLNYSVQETVPILTSAQILALAEELEPVVALSYMPVSYESRTVLSETLAYYEHPLGTGQDQLIPTYALQVEYDLGNQEVTTDTIYIPANPEYMAPLALISPMEIPDHVAIGDEIVFQAVDATTNLSDAGYNSSLDFALGTGDPDSYLYSWYRDSVSDENLIGTGDVFTYTVGLGGETHSGMDLTAQSIILQVTDSFSPRPPSTSYDQVQLAIVPPVYLPIILRDS
jgi:hypothetical protein